MTAVPMNGAAYELVQAFPHTDEPIISLGSIFVGEKTVSVCGSVSHEFASNAELRINGYLVPITRSARFGAVVTLAGDWGIEIALTVPAGERFVLTLPMAGI